MLLGSIVLDTIVLNNTLNVVRKFKVKIADDVFLDSFIVNNDWLSDIELFFRNKSQEFL